MHTLNNPHSISAACFTSHCPPWSSQSRLPRRRLLPRRVRAGNIKDHVNPASWSGNTNPATVNLGVQWNVGAALAGQALTADGVYTAEEVNYAQIATTSDATMLQPRGVAGGRPGVSPHIDRRTH